MQRKFEGRDICARDIKTERRMASRPVRFAPFGVGVVTARHVTNFTGRDL